MQAFRIKKSLRKEFKRQLKLALIAGTGFVIAYAWKERLLLILDSLSTNLANAAGIGQSPLFMPILTTFLGVLLIYILSKTLN